LNVSFKGLYKEDERAGPGVMTYVNGSQDVGIWHGEKLVKICSPIRDAFTMSKHTDFDYNPSEHVCYLEDNEASSKDQFERTLTEPEILYAPESKVTEKVSNIFNIALDPRSLAVNKEAFDKEFFPLVDEKDNKSVEGDKIKLWNKTPSVIALQKHFHKHSYGKRDISYNVESVIRGDRAKFNDKGKDTFF